MKPFANIKVGRSETEAMISWTPSTTCSISSGLEGIRDLRYIISWLIKCRTFPTLWSIFYQKPQHTECFIPVILPKPSPKVSVSVSATSKLYSIPKPSACLSISKHPSQSTWPSTSGPTTTSCSWPTQSSPHWKFFSRRPSTGSKKRSLTFPDQSPWFCHPVTKSYFSTSCAAGNRDSRRESNSTWRNRPCSSDAIRWSSSAISKARLRCPPCCNMPSASQYTRLRDWSSTMSYFSTFLKKARVPTNGTSSKIWTLPPVRSPKRNTIEIYRFTTPPQSPNINLRVQMGAKRKNRKRWSKRFSLNRPSTERQILT